VEVKSSDVQGWEYNARRFMADQWFKSFAKRARLPRDEWHAHLMKMYHIAEVKMLVVDSDGFVHKLPFYITLSGKPTTHIENSDNRAALADTINGYDRLPPMMMPSATNGDDCVEKLRNPKGYDALGFVVTDVVDQSKADG
jgi:hypothetical protein